MASAAVILPALALGMQGVSLIASGAGNAAALRNQATQAKMQQEVGELQATQIDTTYRNELNTTIHNIRAVAASAGADVNSPAIDAFIGGETKASDRDRRIAVSNARMQSNQSGLDALALQRAARWSLIGGTAEGLASFAKIPGTFPKPSP